VRATLLPSLLRIPIDCLQGFELKTEFLQCDRRSGAFPDHPKILTD
jgi:hypothetical protein